MAESKRGSLRVLVLLLGMLVIAGLLLSPRLVEMLAEARRIEAQLDRPTSGNKNPGSDLPAAAEVLAAKQAVDAGPNDYDARLRYASLLGRSRRYLEAIDQVKSASLLRPDKAEPHLAMAEIYETRDWLDRALEERREAVRLEPERPEPVAALSYMYVAFGWNLPAKRLLERAVATHPNDPLVRNALAMILYQMMDYRGALKEIEAAKRLDPKNHALDGPLIDVYMRLNDPKAAIAAADRAMISDGENPAFHLERAKALRAAGDFTGAEQEARWVLGKDPMNLEARYELALNLKQKSDDAGAQKALEMVVGSNPLYESATALLAQYYFRQGRKADAKVLLKTFDEKRKQADPSLKWYLKVGSAPDDATAHRELGRIHLRRNKIARGIVELKEALRLRPGDPVAVKALRTALERQGRSAEARMVQ